MIIVRIKEDMLEISDESDAAHTIGKNWSITEFDQN
jgi:hypothetical protein